MLIACTKINFSNSAEMHICLSLSKVDDIIFFNVYFPDLFFLLVPFLCTEFHTRCHCHAWPYCTHSCTVTVVKPAVKFSSPYCLCGFFFCLITKWRQKHKTCINKNYINYPYFLYVWRSLSLWSRARDHVPSWHPMSTTLVLSGPTEVWDKGEKQFRQPPDRREWSPR